MVGARVGPDVVLLTLGAAVLHASWNAIAAGIAADRVIGFVLIGIADTTAAPVLGLPPRPSWAFIVASAVIHIAYQLLLLASYQLGEFSQVYPLARGTSPWVVAVVSITVLSRELPVTELVGVLIISAGLISLMFVGGRPSRTQLPALSGRRRKFVGGLCRDCRYPVERGGKAPSVFCCRRGALTISVVVLAIHPRSLMGVSR